MNNCKDHAVPLFSESVAKPFTEMMEKVVTRMEKSVKGALKTHHNLYPNTLPAPEYVLRSIKNGIVHGLQSSLGPETLIDFGDKVSEQGIPCNSEELIQRYKEAPGLTIDQAIAMFALYANHNGITRKDVAVLLGEQINIEMAFDSKFKRAEFRSLTLLHPAESDQPFGFEFKSDTLMFTSSKDKSAVQAFAVEVGEAALVILTLGLSKLIEKLCEDDDELDKEEKDKLKKIQKRLQENLDAWEKELKELEKERNELDEDIDKLDESNEELESEIEDLEDDIDDEDDAKKKKELRGKKKLKRKEKRRKAKEKREKEKLKKEKDKKFEEMESNLENAKDAVDEIEDILD